MTLNSSDIISHAKAILAPHDIKIVDLGEDSPEEHLYRQYLAIADEVDHLDMQTWEIARKYLGCFTDDNKVVRLLQIRCGSAFEPPSESDAIFLETCLNNPLLLNMGAHDILADFHQEREDVKGEQHHLIWQILSTNNKPERFERLRDSYQAAGAHQEQLRFLEEMFTNKGILVPGASGQTRLEL